MSDVSLVYRILYILDSKLSILNSKILQKQLTAEIMNAKIGFSNIYTIIRS